MSNQSKLRSNGAAILWLGVLSSVATAQTGGATVFATEGVWQDDRGRELAWAALAGRVRVVAMFYSGCHLACPTTVAAMQWIEKNLPPAARATTEFVLVTLDPGGDTVRDLHAFRAEQRLSARWTLLRGNRAATRELADTLGISFRLDATRLTHTAAIVVLDAAGRIVSRHTTLHPELRGVIASVGSLGGR